MSDELRWTGAVIIDGPGIDIDGPGIDIDGPGIDIDGPGVPSPLMDRE